MSDAPDLPETEAFAAEHALGVLGAAERRAAETRMAAEPAFAAQVEAWRERLRPLLDQIAPVPVSPALWPSIERALPANDNGHAVRGLRVWRATALGSLTLAAASLAMVVFLANRPPVVIQPPAPGQLLNASLVSQSAQPQPLFVAAYDPTRRALIVTSLVTPGNDPAHVHELWVIPSDGKPRPLGIVEPGKTVSLKMPPSLLPSLIDGSALAVSVEPPGGSPKVDAPSGPIAAVGKLAKI